MFLLTLAMAVHYSMQGCTIGAGWQRLTMGERLLAANAVVYGRTIQHLASMRTVFGRTSAVVDALFEVNCVIKSGEADIGPVITIEGVTPRDACSGSTGNMQIGQEAFVALKPTADGNFEFDEVMPAQSAVFQATRSNFLEISRLCGLQSWLPPVNATVDSCPVCGVANFTSSVMATDDSTGSSPCIINGALVSNSSDCDVILTGTSNTEDNCIATTFANTCTHLLYSFEEVVCVCTYNSNNHGYFPDVDTAGQARSSYTVVLGFLLAFMLKYTG